MERMEAMKQQNFKYKREQKSLLFYKVDSSCLSEIYKLDKDATTTVYKCVAAVDVEVRNCKKILLSLVKKRGYPTDSYSPNPIYLHAS